ncbi:hypothetical protein [Rummeliibacillus stabekisii]|uniref:hypothetical protein n=1 Tax=Rummeliibacillus stabekisii TaxID=241244 RepID=UPI00116CEA6E|nr:hypothetical protein [Rummeliibacillus stabekisii]GEL05785.1 hypothetical protein RST01_24120 [Rummeliibacillus stabekisii]
MTAILFLGAKRGRYYIACRAVSNYNGEESHQRMYHHGKLGEENGQVAWQFINGYICSKLNLDYLHNHKRI